MKQPETVTTMNVGQLIQTLQRALINNEISLTPSGQNKLGPSPERAKLRAKTYQGIADAMADQWGTL